ncbi:MAG: ABC transporter permease [Anaerolineales bacterium]|jgi:peptide/nickel transport system permease protein
MYRYILRRLFSTIFTLLGITVVVFLLLRVAPGSIIDTKLGIYSERTPELIAEMEAYFGLDKPLYIQYFYWLRDMLMGDFGDSWRTGTPVVDLIKDSLPVTVELAFLAMLITVVIGIPVGVISAIRKDKLFDNTSRILSFAALGLPNFWQAAMMILIASLVFNWFPPMNYVSFFEDPAENLKLMILPAIALGTVNVANVVRLTRSSTLEELPKDYVRTARSKGLKERVVVWNHGVRNALISIVTIIGLMVGYLLGGAVTVEAVFTLPGLGRLILWSIYQRDYPVTQVVLLLTCAMFVLINFFVDILYAFINPQIRYD